MERTHGLPLTGPGLEALELGTDAVPAGTVPAGATVDPAAEPTGYLVAMDGDGPPQSRKWIRTPPSIATR